MAPDPVDRAATLVEQAGTTSVAAHLALAPALCSLCRDDLDQVVSLLEARLDSDDGRGAMGEMLGVAPPLIEAYAALGRLDDATRLTERFTAAPDPAVSVAARATIRSAPSRLAASTADSADPPVADDRHRVAALPTCTGAALGHFHHPIFPTVGLATWGDHVTDDEYLRPE